MKLYCVFGVEYHVCSELLGIYDSYEQAENRKLTVDSFGYDVVEVREIYLNKDIN